jgi:hypothetical protein
VSGPDVMLRLLSFYEHRAFIKCTLFFVLNSKFIKESAYFRLAGTLDYMGDMDCGENIAKEALDLAKDFYGQETKHPGVILRYSLIILHSLVALRNVDFLRALPSTYNHPTPYPCLNHWNVMSPHECYVAVTALCLTTYGYFLKGKGNKKFDEWMKKNKV